MFFLTFIEGKQKRERKFLLGNDNGRSKRNGPRDLGVMRAVVVLT